MCDIRLAAKQNLSVLGVGNRQVENKIGRADDPVAGGNTHRALPSFHLVDNKAPSWRNLVVAQIVGNYVVIVVITGERADEYATFTRDGQER